MFPETGEVLQVDAGLADIVQRMMDRGLVIDTKNSRSAMVTDHPGMRWIHDDTVEGMSFRYPTGTHIYEHYESERPRIVFPTDNTIRYRNDDDTLEAIHEAARLSGLLVEEHVNRAQPQKGVAVELPYLMDGTSYDAFLKESKAHVEKHTEARFTMEREAWVTQMNQSKQAVVEMHGGVALYSDNMILDRLSRFERAVQRLMVEDRHITRDKSDEYHWQFYHQTTCTEDRTQHQQEHNRYCTRTQYSGIQTRKRISGFSEIQLIRIND